MDAGSPYRLDQDGRSHRFCSEACRADYARAIQGESVPGVSFQCAMHPEVPQDRLGECAICGIALAPVRANTGGDATAAPAGGLLGRLRAALGV